MYSFNFPDMFSGGRANLIEDKKAAISNLKLVLGSWKSTLLGDPFFGTSLYKYFFNQNSLWIRDLIADQVYETIIRYVPQIRVKRNSIQVSAQRDTIFIDINFQYITDQTLDTLSIAITE